MKKKLAIVVLGVFLVGIIIYVFFSGPSNRITNNPTENSTTTNKITSTTKTNVTPTTKTKVSGTHIYISILKDSFSPKAITIKAGTTVTWTNKDTSAHTVTSDYGGPTSGNLLKGGTYTYKFSTKGIVGYHCSLHSTTTGMIIVE
ncbi:MAG: cupredoxin domain-containing protein [Candidatus Paceibacterota bacterium]|jgi:plastocyanin